MLIAQCRLWVKNGSEAIFARCLLSRHLDSGHTWQSRTVISGSFSKVDLTLRPRVQPSQGKGRPPIVVGFKVRTTVRNCTGEPRGSEVIRRKDPSEEAAIGIASGCSWRKAVVSQANRKQLRWTVHSDLNRLTTAGRLCYAYVAPRVSADCNCPIAAACRRAGVAGS